MDIRLAALLVCIGGVIGGASRPAAVSIAQPDGNSSDLIREMERQRGTTPAPAPASTPAPGSLAPSAVPPAPGAPAIEPGSETLITGSRLLREGTLVNQRRGRMSKIAGTSSAAGASGDWVFTFDSDGRGRGEPPMVLLPCTNLMQMERVVERSGESVSFTVTGQVFVYKGRNYLLPTLYLVNRRSELNSGR